FAFHDLARKALSDRRLAHAGIADEQRIVLLAAAKDLDRAIDFRRAADQRIDAAGFRLLVQVHAIGFERLGALLVLGLALFALLLGAARGLLLAHARALGDAVAHVAHRIEARHVLLLQEIDGMALALGEQRDQHIGASDFLAAGVLHVENRTLHDA